MSYKNKSTCCCALQAPGQPSRACHGLLADLLQRNVGELPSRIGLADFEVDDILIFFHAQY